MNDLPKSIHNAVIDGVQRLYVLRLDGAPADDTLPLTTQVWLDAIGYRRQWADDDLPRLQQAFVALTATARRWPQPATLLELLPPRPAPLALPAPKKTAAERAADASWLENLINKLTGKMHITKDKNHEPGTNPRTERTAAATDAAAGGHYCRDAAMRCAGHANAPANPQGDR
mgnify:FL=1